MPVHRFAIGQTVRMTAWNRFSADPKEIFRIVAKLPAHNNLLQYRIRSDNERHERVTTEDNLEKVDTPTLWKSAR